MRTGRAVVVGFGGFGYRFGRGFGGCGFETVRAFDDVADEAGLVGEVEAERVEEWPSELPGRPQGNQLEVAGNPEPEHPREHGPYLLAKILVTHVLKLKKINHKYRNIVIYYRGGWL